MQLLVQIAEEDGVLIPNVMADHPSLRKMVIDGVERCASDPAHFSFWEYDSDTQTWTKLAANHPAPTPADPPPPGMPTTLDEALSLLSRYVKHVRYCDGGDFLFRETTLGGTEAIRYIDKNWE